MLDGTKYNVFPATSFFALSNNTLNQVFVPHSETAFASTLFLLLFKHVEGVTKNQFKQEAKTKYFSGRL